MTQPSRQTKGRSLRTAILLTALGTVISGLSLPASAATYRWLDDNGIVNYSERKPKDVPESRVTLVSRDVKTRSGSRARQTRQDEVTLASNTRTRTAPPTTVPELPQKADLSADQQAMLEKLQQAEAERQATVAQIKNDNCDRSRRVLSNLSQNARLKVSGKDGTVRVMSEEERQKGISDAQRGIAENCTS
jgi:hypothetical protein